MEICRSGSRRTSTRSASVRATVLLRIRQPRTFGALRPRRTTEECGLAHRWPLVARAAAEPCSVRAKSKGCFYRFVRPLPSRAFTRSQEHTRCQARPRLDPCVRRRGHAGFLRQVADPEGVYEWSVEQFHPTAGFYSDLEAPEPVIGRRSFLVVSCRSYRARAARQGKYPCPPP